jgi:PAS domain S-box-containing protein
MATVIQDSNDAITIQDLEGNILAWNRGAEQIYGYSESEALQMNIIDTVPESHRLESLNFIAALKLGELVPVLETKRKVKNGRIIDVWLTNTKLVDDKGKLTGVATTGRDITERKQGEISLREKAQELEFLREGQITLSDKMRGEQDVSSLGQSVLSHLAPFLNAQMGAFYVLTEENTLRRVAGYAYARNDGEQKTIHLGEGLIGQTALERRPIIIDSMPESYFGTIRSDLGESVPRSILIAPVFYDGKVNGVIELATFSNFSDHQKTFVEHVSENIGIAINTSTSRKRLQGLLSTSQILTEKMQAQQQELQAANDGLAEQSRALKLSQTRLTAQQSELEKTNQKLETQTQVLEEQRDTLNEKNDALHKAQDLLQVRSDEVQRASQYKSEFLANMSHELRTPLNSSLILAKLLSDNKTGNLTPEQVQYSLSIYSAGNDLLNLINDILDLSKVEAGKLEIRLESVFLPKVLSSLERTFAPIAIEKNLKFNVMIEDHTPESILTDRQRLEQILKNLLSNAVKFTERGEVTLRAYPEQRGRIGLQVIDSGIGVKKAQQGVIFEAFRQADGTTNRNYGGTGLGLSISRDLARLLGGTVEVESVPGKGSTFTLILPEIYNESLVLEAGPKVYTENTKNPVPLLDLAIDLAIDPVTLKSAQDAIEQFKDDRASLDQKSRKILVIEDDPIFTRLLFDLAHELNYQCLVARTADEGIDFASTFIPDAIILDIKLPDRSGLTVLDHLKENSLTRHIPVTICSGYDYAEKTMEMGAIGYILKPAPIEALKKAFEEISQRLSQKTKRILVVEDEKLQRESMIALLSGDDAEVVGVEFAGQALTLLKNEVFDCVVVDLKLPDMPGEVLLKRMAEENLKFLPPVIVYTGRSLSRDEEDRLRKYSRAIIIKGARSPERLLDEVALFLHRPSQSYVKPSEDELTFDGRKILVVDDDVRNIFALSAALEQKGATVVVARNGQEAVDKMNADPKLDLVLMDIMMPVMDGYEATRLLRKEKRFTKLPIIAVTAKATKNDQVLCMEAGTNDYLSKPINLDQLFSLIRVWLPKLGRD